MELFLPSTANDEFVSLSSFAERVHRFDFGDPVALGGYRIIRVASHWGRGVAERIDAGGFDAVLTGASWITTAPEILPHLRTPSLYYSPEHRRADYDRPAISPSVGRRLLEVPQMPLWRWVRRFDRRAIHEATGVFTHSRFIAGKLSQIYGIEASVVPLGVDTELYAPSGVRREGFVLSVGALDPRKGHQLVIESLATVPAGHRPRLVVVGDRGDFGPELERLAVARAVDLELAVDRPFDEVVGLYNRAGVLAAGQVEEPFGLITLEAMACGTPVVAVAEGGFLETVEDGRTGLLVPRDPARFGEAIATVLGDPQLAARLGREGRDKVSGRWRWSHTASRIDGLLDDVRGSRV